MHNACILECIDNCTYSIPNMCMYRTPNRNVDGVLVIVDLSELPVYILSITASTVTLEMRI